MATYTVWLKVRDCYGNIREINSGTIDIALDGLSQSEVNKIEEMMNLNDTYATDNELTETVTETIKEITTLKYKNFDLVTGPDTEEDE